MPPSLKLGSRKSALAQAQSRWVAAQLQKIHSGLKIKFILISTAGDRHEGELPQGGLKAMFTKEIEEALLDQRIDLAVHSLKDMSAEPPKGLAIGAVPLREDPRDVWLSKNGTAFAKLPKGARIATGAVRRQAQLRHLRPDLELLPMRGNVDTRLTKLKTGDYDGMILAAAGLNRLGRTEKVEPISEKQLLPAIGQGCLAIQIRADDTTTQKLLQPLEDKSSRAAADAERAFLKALGGSCQTPIAALGRVAGAQLILDGLVVSPDGKTYLREAKTGPVEQADAIGRQLAEHLLARGAGKILSL